MPSKLCCLIVLTLPLCLGRVPTGAAESPQTIQLQLQPQGEPQYALRYLFETPYMKQRPGNAALLYPSVVAHMTRADDDSMPDRQTVRQWRDLPIDQAPIDEIRSMVEKFDLTLRRLELATDRQWCIWESPIREEGFGFLLPHLAEYRRFSEILVFKARLQIHDGQVDQAMDTIRMGITLARDVAKGPSLIENLVGVAIAARMAGEIENLIESSQAPNLYWALTVLPDPLIDMRTAMQTESDILFAEIPELETLEDKPLTNEQAAAIFQRVNTFIGSMENDPDILARNAAMVAGALKIYPEAKARLIEQGRNVQEVESLPPLYVVLLDQFRQYRIMRDMQFKWTYLPYWQARKGMDDYNEYYASKQGDFDIMVNPFLTMIPAIQRVTFLRERLRRHFAMLRTIEAIRMYAADHNGQLPKALDDITAVPIPLDPLRGKPFTYQVNGRNIVLEAPIPPKGSAKEGRRYEITMR